MEEDSNEEKDVIEVVLVFLLSTLTYFTPFSSVSVFDFEQVNVSWEKILSNRRFC